MLFGAFFVTPLDGFEVIALFPPLIVAGLDLGAFLNPLGVVVVSVPSDRPGGRCIPLDIVVVLCEDVIYVKRER